MSPYFLLSSEPKKWERKSKKIKLRQNLKEKRDLYFFFVVVIFQWRKDLKIGSKVDFLDSSKNWYAAHIVREEMQGEVLTVQLFFFKKETRTLR